MEISTNELKDSIKSLVKEQDRNEVLDLLMNEMTELQLQNVIQTILDPEFHSKQNTLSDPKRFMVKGELDQVKKATVDVKVTSGV
jgi:hypothetical protein